MSETHGTKDADINISDHECQICGAKPRQEHVWYSHQQHKRMSGAHPTKDANFNATDHECQICGAKPGQEHNRLPHSISDAPKRTGPTNRTDGRGRTVVMYGMEEHCPVPDCPHSGHQSHEHTYGLGDKAQREGDQPAPIVNSKRDIQSLVIEDMEARRALGIRRYGTALQPHNGRDALVDLYEELLDAVMYAKQAIVERDSHVAQAPGQQSGNH